ncbi:hypothetical protein MES4922_640008 [Mesorhizobium ventifaucium]|uniref:Uncharacterized protein n=1 Tax=Mesorhizobium ventifaucium TaxID=666020 RepID=A0ABM9EF48_9HYPH|nr:hypothetical protein MES4922_640008 [Mesorhizobium ventifaucium]
MATYFAGYEGPRVRYVGWAAFACIQSRVSDVMRSFRRLEAQLRIILLGLCATQLTACIAAYPRDGVPTQWMATAEVSGFPATYASGTIPQVRQQANRPCILQDGDAAACDTQPMT